MEKLNAKEIVEIVRDIAKKHGWAIGVHGSLERDIDLIAIPWTEDASGTWPLFEEIRDAVGADHAGVQGDLRKPHGRQALMIIQKGAVSYKGKNGMDDWNPPAIDLSFIDPREAQDREKAVREELVIHREQIEGLLQAKSEIEAERDAAQKELRLIKEAPMGPICNLCRHEGIEDKLDAALMALEKYGRHTNMCGMEEKGHPCICGLDKALANLKKGATS